MSAETPAALGYRWPAEWEPQRAVWLSWPRNPATWPGKFEPVPAEYAKFVAAIAEFEPVHIFAGGDDILPLAQSLVGKLKNVTLHDEITNDSWCRDHGPTFLQAPSGAAPALVDWEYNAWGGKYPPFDLDNLVPSHCAKITGRKRFSTGIILEGGAIETNGAGTLLTTESCLLNPNRNPHMNREAIEKSLRDYLGVREILWLTGGEIAGDDTDGHIDQIARFIDSRTIVCASAPADDEENREPTEQNLRELRAMRDRAGSFNVVELPIPEPLFYDDQRLPASYCNFLMVNGAILVPQFGDRRSDERALSILKSLRPDLEIRGLPSLDLVWGLGSFHCLSQQECEPVAPVVQAPA